MALNTSNYNHLTPVGLKACSGLPCAGRDQTGRDIGGRIHHRASPVPSLTETSRPTPWVSGKKILTTNNIRVLY